MIYTVTLHPALDVTLWLSRLNPAEPSVVRRERVYPAGKAVNVSRVLTALGTENSLYGFLGRENGRRFLELLEKEGVRCRLLETPGYIRENLSLVVDEGTLYKVDRAGFPVSPEQLFQLRERLAGEIREETEPLIVFSGSLPPGIGREDYLGLVSFFQKSGARIALDNAFLMEEEIRALHPFVVKPNEMEFQRIMGLPPGTLLGETEILRRAESLSGEAAHVLVSLGEKGLLYAGGGRRARVGVPAVAVKSSVGAGDSTLAGFLAALEGGASLSECLRFAAACGTAAVLAEGTETLQIESVRRLLPEIRVELL